MNRLSLLSALVVFNVFSNEAAGMTPETSSSSRLICPLESVATAVAVIRQSLFVPATLATTRGSSSLRAQVSVAAAWRLPGGYCDPKSASAGRFDIEHYLKRGAIPWDHFTDLTRGLRMSCNADITPQEKQQVDEIIASQLRELEIPNKDLAAADLRAVMATQEISDARDLPHVALKTESIKPDVRAFGAQQWLHASPVDQFLILDGGASGSNLYSAIWLADTWGPMLSETGKVAMVWHCVHNAFRQTPDGLKMPKVAAFCGVDMPVVKSAAVYAEIDLLNQPPLAKLRLKFDLGVMLRDGREVQAWVAAQAKKDKVYKTIFTDIPAQHAAIWKKLESTNAAQLKAAREVLFASRATMTSRSALEGCEAKVMPFLQDIVRRVPADLSDKKMDDGELASTPLNFVLFEALASCSARSGSSLAHYAGYFGRQVEESKWQPGPRTAAMIEVLQRKTELAFDNLQDNEFDRPTRIHMENGTGLFPHSSRGPLPTRETVETTTARGCISCKVHSV